MINEKNMADIFFHFQSYTMGRHPQPHPVVPLQQLLVLQSLRPPIPVLRAAGQLMLCCPPDPRQCCQFQPKHWLQSRLYLRYLPHVQDPANKLILLLFKRWA